MHSSRERLRLQPLSLLRSLVSIGATELRERPAFLERPDRAHLGISGVVREEGEYNGFDGRFTAL